MRVRLSTIGIVICLALIIGLIAYSVWLERPRVQLVQDQRRYLCNALQASIDRIERFQAEPVDAVVALDAEAVQTVFGELKGANWKIAAPKAAGGYVWIQIDSVTATAHAGYIELNPKLRVLDRNRHSIAKLSATFYGSYEGARFDATGNRRGFLDVGAGIISQPARLLQAHLGKGAK